MSSQPNDFSASLTSLRCPSCGIMVRMPAETCPSCKANMRTGLRPEVAEKFTFWHRRWGKVLAVFLLLVGPPLAYGLGYGNLLDLLRSGLAKVGLSSCAEPLNRWDTFNQDEFDQAVRAGYLNWRGNKTFRKLGESPQGPESPLMASRTREQKLQYLDSRTFFASSFMADRPALSLKPENNWYLTLNGEWDIAWIQGKDTPEEKIVAGEWVFSWINDGDALQDVMSIPFRWLKLPAGQMPIFITTIRHFNESRSAWEGFHVQNR
ncbi:MAG: zinc ribbon domain-containing protein, partial [Deltaproteobacteria bacterium]|nr:zinc ribbon domain-containing protein [Deltaproteobacteria bacterium]